MLRAREKSRVQDAIGFGFASHRLKIWREIFEPITKRSAMTFNSYLKSALRNKPCKVNYLHFFCFCFVLFLFFVLFCLFVFFLCLTLCIFCLRIAWWLKLVERCLAKTGSGPLRLLWTVLRNWDKTGEQKFWSCFSPQLLTVYEKFCWPGLCSNTKSGASRQILRSN